MKYNSGLIISTVVLAIMTTGCVKKASVSDTAVVSTSQPIYESGTPIVYETTDTTSSASTVPYTEIATDNTVITTTDNYGQPIASSTGAYNNPYGTESVYADPYANQPIVNNYPTTTPTTTNTNTSSSTGTVGGGIHLQVAALKNYYAAEEFRKGLSLDSKYSSYVKKGAVNKVIVSGISSRAEANELKSRLFPDAFIVSGSATSSAVPPSSTGGYTTNTPYGSSSTPSTVTGLSGLGVQIGAFSTYSRAQSVADSASSRYAPLVKTGNSNGKTIYKAILTGFASEQEARSFIAQRGGVGFVVHGL